MKIKLIAIGNRMPSWVQAGYEEYAKRMPPHCPLELVEIPLPKRQKNIAIEKLIHKEGEEMLNHIPLSEETIALDIKGQSWDTPALAAQFQQWLTQGITLNLLVGGPDGLAPSCLRRAKQHWSLSKLTLPHPLVRIIVAEQLYRAWSLLAKHPYHR